MTVSDPGAGQQQGREAMQRAACLSQWPDAENMSYDPRCCRFPKSCSIPDDPAPSPTPPARDSGRDEVEAFLARYDGVEAPDWETAADLSRMGVPGPAPAPLRTMGGEPATVHHTHPGWPPDPTETDIRQRAGLPVYWPTDPVLIDQRPYLAYAAKTSGTPTDGAHS